MDKEKLKKIFEELLNDYEASEKAVIYEYGSGEPGLTIEDEIRNLRNRIQKYHMEFLEALK